MKLGEYLKKSGLTQAEFAKKIGSHQAHVSELISGKVLPRIPTISLIRDATKGEVDYGDWLQAAKRGNKR